MATDWSSSKKENTNFACLCRLLIDAGTRVLRDIFDSVNPPSTLHSVLHDPAVHNTLQGLKAKKVLTPNQWERLYPKTGTTVTSAGFDITLLFVLLRNICGLSPPPTGWDNLPTPTNKTMEADLARVKFYRNELYGHITEAALSDSEFEKNWKEISGVLIRLGGPRYKPDVERLKVQSMDSEVENNLIKTLKEWEEAEKDLKMAIIKIEKKLEQQIVTHSEGNLYPELVVKCMFKFATGATWLAGSSYLIYHHKDDPESLKTIVSTVVLPTGILVREIIRGSINIIVKATTLDALKELWKRYKEGILEEDLEQVFLTEELRAQAGEDVELVVEMNEEEYTEAKQKLAVEVYKEDYTQVTVSSTFNLDDNQKRWLVIGISLNKVLLPTLREFVKQKMVNHYDDLKANHNIDKQSYSKHLVNDGKCDKLNYRSINNNSAIKGERNYHYKVTSAVDLAKLYLQPHMAKFTDFDETCDLSAVLGILSSASVFSPDVQDLASKVRQEVSNEWGHCNFKTWEEPKFSSCFHLMDSLLQALKLPHGEEKRISDELADWKNKGVQICMGNKVGIELIMVIEKEVDQLSQEFYILASRLQGESKRIMSALQTIQEAIEEFKEINRTLESTNQRVDKLEQGRTEDCRRMDGIEKRVEVLESAAVVKSNHPSEDNIGEARSSDNEDMNELVRSFGALDIISAAEVAERLPQYLNVDRTTLQDPPVAIVKKCQRLCRWLKDNGRKDVVKELRHTLPSGMTGPLLNGNILIQDLDYGTKLNLTRALSVKEEWKIFAQKLGISAINIRFYAATKDNPVMEIFNNHCGNMKIEHLYRLLVEIGANAIADFL